MQEDNNRNESLFSRSVFELRTKLNNGTINQRQYGMEIGKLLAADKETLDSFDKETLDRFDKLEQDYDDCRIDSTEYEKHLISCGADRRGAVPSWNTAAHTEMGAF